MDVQMSTKGDGLKKKKLWNYEFVVFGLPKINGMDDIDAVQQFIGNHDENSTILQAMAC
uniref:Uncharacterized protein n=1 Tax=Romanomermis culicivorax TaxID=13658 RepID=A0A915LAL9_ROMCU